MIHDPHHCSEFTNHNAEQENRAHPSCRGFTESSGAASVSSGGRSSQQLKEYFIACHLTLVVMP